MIAETAEAEAQALATESWRRRQGQAWALGYWNSITQPHRAVLLEALHAVEPVRSAVELGCGAAPCLRLIQARYPGTRCYGIDINVQMLLTAFEQAALEGWDRYLDLEHDDLMTCAVPPADVVFSSYALAYVSPEAITAVIEKMCAAAARAVIFVEPVAATSTRYDPPGHVPEWAHPYAALVTAQPGWESAWFPLPRPEKLLTGAVLARRTHMFHHEGERS